MDQMLKKINKIRCCLSGLLVGVVCMRLPGQCIKKQESQSSMGPSHGRPPYFSGMLSLSRSFQPRPQVELHGCHGCHSFQTQSTAIVISKVSLSMYYFLRYYSHEYRKAKYSTYSDTLLGSTESSLQNFHHKALRHTTPLPEFSSSASTRPHKSHYSFATHSIGSTHNQLTENQNCIIIIQ